MVPLKISLYHLFTISTTSLKHKPIAKQCRDMNLCLQLRKFSSGLPYEYYSMYSFCSKLKVINFWVSISDFSRQAYLLITLSVVGLCCRLMNPRQARFCSQRFVQIPRSISCIPDCTSRSLIKKFPSTSHLCIFANL